MSEGLECVTKYAIAKDPVHVGTGGYRLGRVDNTIVREPGTEVPKIPGSTLNGAARTYSYYSKKEENKELSKGCGLGKKTEDDEKPCGDSDCSICQTYGYTLEAESKRSQVNFSDARILFFPVHSKIGPVWITCPSILEDAGVSYNGFDGGSEEKIKIDNSVDKLNLGWLYLDVSREKPLKNGDFLEKLLGEVGDKIEGRIGLVSDKVFSQVVDSNLEVRTSVSIDPETGAAEEGALFTYEAIPRGTIFWFDLTYNERPNSEVSLKKVKKVVKEGLEKFGSLGVGGMTSRGLGRIEVSGLGD
ncbi:MAG: CRISPR-Cas system related protein, RAMP superfamily Cas7 group [Candidatus Methanohalarchaeum thermophilum]|uniref:CRISPR-Cas system related protein, RAMP superfamily Cas7 group n=1 Tax=Methanohalarchaeum thermophilum TaxID=1903181 RepID=A0A1Q6DVE8_METT1|nr:MAG: CRISPR-Cas system related protein, RAMP superfamily Cas7 group [Candidatus Methanohalarchaeum thermophilum]